MLFNYVLAWAIGLTCRVLFLLTGGGDSDFYDD